KLSHHTAPLIITGEEGVGKTFLAGILHVLGARSTSPFRVINFSVLPQRDQRVDLLGGGPPDLTTTRRSVLELPTTVVLKHIDCASHHLQHELARSLSSARVTRYGTDDFFPVQCRPMFTLRASLISLYRRKRIDPALFSFLRTARTVRIP